MPRMRKSELETAAISQRVRAEHLATKVTDLEHALNLLVNNSVEWFSAFTGTDGTIHRFGVGVAMTVEIQDPINVIVARRTREHRVIIFWRTEFLRTGEGDASEEGDDEGADEDECNAKHCYLSIYSLGEFKALPGKIETAASQIDRNLVNAAESAVKLVDDAVKSYLKVRRPFGMVM